MNPFASRHGVWIFSLACLGAACGLLPAQVNPAAPESVATKREALVNAAFAEIGVTPRDYCVLAHALEGQYTQIELAKIADLDKTTMLNTMDFLERSGWAQRSPSPVDRRARIITDHRRAALAE